MHGADHAGTPRKVPTGFPLTLQKTFSMLRLKCEYETEFCHTLVAEMFEEFFDVVPVLGKDAY